MAMLDAGTRPSHALPSISHLELDKTHSEKTEHSRFPMMSGSTLTNASLGSPNTFYSGPPPPYSCAPSATNGSIHGLSGYISPPESNSRRSTRDEKESPSVNKSLPSISEALKQTDIPMSGSLIGNQMHNLGQGPPSAVAQICTESPKGPVNPFSQPPPPATSSLRDSFSSASGPAEHMTKVIQPPPAPTESHRSASHVYNYPGSPRSGPPGPPRNGSVTFGGIGHQHDASTTRSPYHVEPPRQGYPFPDYHSQSTTAPTRSSSTFNFEPSIKFDSHRNPFVKGNNSVPHGDTVKRHLDTYDAELALNEVSEASSRTLDFSKTWSQRYHRSSQYSYYPEAFPSVNEIDEMIRQSHRIIENLNKTREVVILHETALSEQRARVARGNFSEDDYPGSHEDYKAGGFAGGDSKKRRGKAAPPGRCHSCNRAETPEWRRGPDGARTLCNACGLHYAKLTRKMGANKAASMTGSSLRPKTIDPRSPVP